MGWLYGCWDGNSMLKFQHTYADFPAGKIPNADISAHMLERQHNEYYKLKNCHQDTDCVIRVTAATPRRQSSPTLNHTFRLRHKVAIYHISYIILEV